MLLDKIEEPAARDWYVRQCVAGGWSRNVLLNQIIGRAHARAGAAPSNFKLSFYIAAVDDRLRDPARHAPTVGILMCADRNDTVVRYALSGAAQPMAVAGYTYDALPAAERAALPSATRGWPQPWKPQSTWTVGR